MRKRGRSASLDTPHQSSFPAPREPSPCPMAGKEDTPMNSPTESLTGSQIAQVKHELIEDDPLRGLCSSVHCPANAMSDDSPSPSTKQWPSIAHSRHTTPAPDFACLPPHFTPTSKLPPFTARIGGNDEDDGPALSDHTPTEEPDPALATTHLINNTIRKVVNNQLNPIVAQLNALTKFVTALNEHNIPIPPATTAPISPPAAPPKAAPTQPRKQPQTVLPSTPPVESVLPAPVTDA
jgi:hypothetical protein